MSLPRIAAVGAGRMGRGIAHVFAYAGYPATLIDLKPRDPADAARLREEAMAEIAASLDTLSAAGLMDAAAKDAVLGRIAFAGRETAAAALAAAEVIMEGVPETLEAKREAFAFVSAHARPNAIIGSTTSTLDVDTLASFVSHPERFLNAHWLNPAYLIPLVEISPGKATLPEVTARTKALMESAGKVAVVCAPAPGYIAPRIQTVMMNEAARIVEQGLATAEDVDKATRYGLGFRYAILGVLEFIDYGGGDILYYAGNHLAKALDDPRYRPPEIVQQNMREGRLGLRSGEGFYDYRDRDRDAYRRETLLKLLALLRHLDLVQPPGSALPDSPAQRPPAAQDR